MLVVVFIVEPSNFNAIACVHFGYIPRKFFSALCLFAIGKMMTKLAQSNLNRAFHLVGNFMPSLHVSFISRIDIDYRLAIVVSDRRYRENQLLSHSYAASKQCFYLTSLAKRHRTLYSFSFYSRPLLYSHVAALPVALQSPPDYLSFDLTLSIEIAKHKEGTLVDSSTTFSCEYLKTRLTQIAHMNS